MRTATFQLSESGGSLNGLDLFTLSYRNPYQTPHSLNCLPLFTEKPFFTRKSALSHPLPKKPVFLNRVQQTVPGKLLKYLRLLVPEEDSMMTIDHRLVPGSSDKWQ